MNWIVLDAMALVIVILLSLALLRAVIGGGRSRQQTTSAPPPRSIVPSSVVTPTRTQTASVPTVVSAATPVVATPVGAVPMPPLRQLSKRERNAILMEAARRQDKIAGRS